ncbi:MAG: OmpH family outer membrane protein [Proteobacteria bacterium]|nr:OmpH family outer membrane protein [Pseudomonadota bacterium]MBU4296592.1 OmpH family outer membrane protein [Pseudomonadota bacterium]MCG2748221.1 OmpH family outer membrane protein [Desulfobulbaceae bacterium]
MFTVTRFFFSLFLLFLSTAVPGSASAADDSPAASAVIVEDANLRTSPTDTSKIITPLRKETKVLAKDRQKEWVKVEVPDLAETGWVHKSLIKENQGLQVAQTNEKKIIEPGPQKIPKKISKKEKQPNRPMQVIGVIDIQQVVNQSLRGREARERFEEMRRAGQTEQIDRVEKEMISHLIAEIQTIVEKYAIKKGFTQVLNMNSGSIFYNDSSFDITDDIIREYDRQASLQQPAP